jgi:tetratricopeptide (TPR) repeat protein
LSARRRRAKKPADPAAAGNNPPTTPATVESEPRFGLWIGAAVALALLARLIVLGQLHGHPLLRPVGVLDDAEYFRLAQRAAAGDWVLGPGAYYVSPLYVYFLATVFRVLGVAAIHAQVVQILLGAAAVALVARTARRLFGVQAALLAATLAALTGVLAFNEVLILQSALDPFLAALALDLLAAALLSPTALRFAAAGASFGLLGLNRPNALAAAAVLLLLALAATRSRGAALRTLAFAVGLSLALAPVTIRNRIVTGHWVLVASHGGLNFYIGNNPEADGAYQSPPGVTPSIAGQAADTRRVAEEAGGRALTDSEVSDYYYALGWEWIRRDKTAAAKLFLRKLALAWHAVELPLNYAYAYWSSDEPTLLRFLVVGPWILVPLGLAGLFVPARVDRRALLMWAAFLPAYAAAVALFFVASRYRLPLVMALCITSGAALDWLWRALSVRSAAGWRPVAAAGALGALLAYWPWGTDDGLAYERTERIVHLIAEGRHDDARDLVERTVPLHADPGLLHYRVGRAWLDAGRPEAALPHFEKSLLASPGQGEVHLVFGQALLHLKRPAEAVPHIERARATGAFVDVAGLDLARARLALSEPDAARAVVAGTKLLPDTDAATATSLGVLAVTLRDPQSAIRFLEFALARAPGLADAHEHLGLAQEQLGRGTEAIASLEAACRLDPADPTAHFNLALLYARAGRLADAQRMARLSLNLDPSARQTRDLLEELARP